MWLKTGRITPVSSQLVARFRLLRDVEKSFLINGAVSLVEPTEIYAEYPGL